MFFFFHWHVRKLCPSKTCRPWLTKVGESGRWVLARSVPGSDSHANTVDGRSVPSPVGRPGEAIQLSRVGVNGPSMVTCLELASPCFQNSSVGTITEGHELRIETRFSPSLLSLLDEAFILERSLFLRSSRSGIAWLPKGSGV